MDGPTMQAVVPPIVVAVEAVTRRTWIEWLVDGAQVLAAISIALTLLLALQERIINSQPSLRLIKDKVGRVLVVNTGKAFATDVLVKIDHLNGRAYGVDVVTQQDAGTPLADLRADEEADLDLANMVLTLLRRDLLPQLTDQQFGSNTFTGTVSVILKYLGATLADDFTTRYHIGCSAHLEHTHTNQGSRQLVMTDLFARTVLRVHAKEPGILHRLRFRALRTRLRWWWRQLVKATR